MDYESIYISILKKESFVLKKLTEKGPSFVRFKYFRKIWYVIVSNSITFKYQLLKRLYRKVKMNTRIKSELMKFHRFLNLFFHKLEYLTNTETDNKTSE